jgi:hypothetical protein
MKISICIATGGSLTQEQVDFVRGKGKVYVVSDAYRLASWADVLYSCDYDWWDYHQPDFSGEKWTVCPRASEKYNLSRLELVKSVWSDKQGAVAGGGNSGFQCLNMAVLDGADRIVLLGYDFHARQKAHFFGDHPHPLLRNTTFDSWIERMHQAAPHIKTQVINCSPYSAIDCFPKVPLQYAFDKDIITP